MLKLVNPLTMLLAFVCMISCANNLNAGTIQKPVSEFVNHLKQGEVESATKLFVYSPDNTVGKENLQKELLILSKDPIIRSFTQLRICEWALSIENKKEYVTGQGIIDYSSGRSRFTASLYRNSDGSLQIVGFRLEPKLDASPWGAC